MRYRESQAPPPLDRWVRCFWHMSAGDCGRQVVVPDGRLEIVLHLADPLAVERDGKRHAQDAVVVAGQLTGPLHLVGTGSTEVIGIRFRTAAARDFLRLPLGSLTDRVLPLREIDASFAARLVEAAHSSAPRTGIACALLDQIRNERRPGTAAAVALLARGDSVSAVARKQNMSTRTLERHVLEDTGLAPKSLQRIIRFRGFYAAAIAGTADRGREALRAGYYDQAHACREFRALTGTSLTSHLGEHSQFASALMSHSS